MNTEFEEFMANLSNGLSAHLLTTKIALHAPRHVTGPINRWQCQIINYMNRLNSKQPMANDL